MDRYAQLQNNIVVYVIESDTDPDGINGGWVACGADVGPGHTYAGGVFTPPVAPAEEPVKRHLAVGSFFDRFGPLKIAILSSTDATVKALILDCSVRKYIDLDNEELPFGIDLLIAAGYAVDKTAILTAPITESELP